MINNNILISCKVYNIKNYTINEDGSIDVDGSVDLDDKGLTELPLKFRNVTGNFSCENNKLTSLKGCPLLVGGHFNCSINLLTSLEYCPESVGSSFFCSHNQLTSLEYSPKYTKYDFYCNNNKLKSFKFMPKCNILHCGYNNIKDFKYFIETISNLYCDGNPIYKIWILFKDKSYIELLNEYDCIRDNNIILDRLNQFLEDIDKPLIPLCSTEHIYK